MAEGPRSERDAQFALGLADELAGPHSSLLNDPDSAGLLDDLDRSVDGDGLLHAIEQQVGRYSERGARFLSANLRRFFAAEFGKIRRIYRGGERGTVLMLKGLRNGFELDLIVDIFNEDARRALEFIAQGDRSSEDERGGERPAPPYSIGWARALADRGAPVEVVAARAASFSFLTLMTDMLRLVAGSGGASGAGPTGGGLIFTAHCNRHGWILDCWPQYNYSPVRFGSVPTWPVLGSLPTSGNYYFQGLQGAIVRQDGTLHYASMSNSSTIVSL